MELIAKKKLVETPEAHIEASSGNGRTLSCPNWESALIWIKRVRR
jgi:hypothetical protein